MQRSRATRLGRAGLLLPLLLASACAAVPDLGSKSAPASASDYASAQSLSGTQSAWPSRFRTAQALAQRESRAFTLDVQLVRALGGGFAIPDNKSAGGFAAPIPQEQS